MVAQLKSSQSSSDYFGEEDSQFLEALRTMVLPGDKPREVQRETREKSISTEEEEEEEEPPPPAQPGLKRRRSDTQLERETISLTQDDNIYGPSHFGQFGEYMRRKRAKLQIQNKELESDEPGSHTISNGIFRGLAIYINGWTQPSVQDLRKLIVENGGVFQPYLDRKSIVTHIVTCSLTPAKVKEFKSMKVVRPEWLIESVKSDALLPWQEYVFKPLGRVENSQGKSIKQWTIINDVPTRDKSTSAPANNNKALITRSLPDPVDGRVLHLPETEDPLYTADPQIDNGASRIPGYASSTSNPNARRAMANPEWRKAHTSIAPDFIEGYYKNSRLHHLATWKSELRALVMEAQERAEANVPSTPGKISGSDGGVSMRGEHLDLTLPRKWKGKGKAKPADSYGRVIMHCDFDCFFVSAGLVSRPELKGKPVVVCHSQGSQGGESSTSEIASCSYEARQSGVRNGMSLQQGRKLCPSVVTIPYEFERYKEFSLKFYTVLMSHADDVQAVSVDEALIDITNAVRARAEAIEMEVGDTRARDPAKEVAESIRDAVREATKCEVSIGIAHNILLARLATRRAKPANSYHLVPAEISEHLFPLDISDLHGFGYNTKQKAISKLGTSKLGELLDKSKRVLCDALGRATGETLYNAIRGIDDKQLESSRERKSVSCEINYGIRFENHEQAERFVYQMAEEVKRRLDEVQMLGRMITLKIMRRDLNAPVEPPKFLGHGKCDTFNKQSKLIGIGGRAVNDDKAIGEHTWRMLKSFDFDPRDLRGIGIQIQKLEPAKSDSSHLQGNQAALPFKKAEIEPGRFPGPVHNQTDFNSRTGFALTMKGGAVSDYPCGPPTRAETIDLPSFSQVDMSVFEALPKEVRDELEMEYKRRLASPPPGPATRGPITAPASKPQPFIRPCDPREGIFPQQPAARRGTDYKRIAQQLAPRRGTSIYANKALLRALGMDKPKPPSVRVSDIELQSLNIDPEVFAMLPIRVQREQLVRARLIKKNGSVPDEPTQRKILKPAKPFISPSRRRRRGPAPKAVYIQPPILRQQGKDNTEKLVFSETTSIQSVIEKWVIGYRHWAPKEKDIEFFSKYLIKCVESKEGDMGLERAVAIMKWWLILLRRLCGGLEEVEDETHCQDPNNRAAIAWWKAFRDVKQRLDEAAKRRFGGKLSLK